MRFFKTTNPNPITAPSSKAEVAEAIRQLGAARRAFDTERAAMNDEISTITKRYQPKLEDLEQRAQALEEAISTWCTSHRTELCGDGSKTATFVSGSVSWRARPASVRITDADNVIDTLRRLGLDHMIRTKTEINKQAILANQDAVKGIKGVEIVAGTEAIAIEANEE